MFFRFTSGPKILVDFGNKILDELEEASVQPGATVRISRSPGGSLLDVIQTAVSSGISPSPFDLRCTVNSGATQIAIKIIPGAVNGLLPSNYDATITKSYTPPPGSPITYYAFVSCVTDGKAITAVTWDVGTSPPSGQVPLAWSAPTAFSYLFGVIVGAGAFRTIAKSSLSFNPALVIQIPKTSITPNAIPYDNYYDWVPVNGTG